MAKKIEEMGLEELKAYACARHNTEKKWYRHCKDCKSLSLCKTGTRVMGILKDDPLKAEKTESEFRKNVDEKYMEAMGQDDPIAYLVEKGYFKTRKQARESYRSWLINRGLYTPVKHQGTGIVERKIQKYFKTGDRITDGLAFLQECDPETEVFTQSAKLYAWGKEYPELCKDRPVILQLAREFSRFKKAKTTVHEMIEQLKAEQEGAKRAVEELRETATDGDEMSIDDVLREAETAGVYDENTPGDILITRMPANFVEAQSVIDKAQQETNRKLNERKYMTLDETYRLLDIQKKEEEEKGQADLREDHIHRVVREQAEEDIRDLTPAARAEVTQRGLEALLNYQRKDIEILKQTLAQKEADLKHIQETMHLWAIATKTDSMMSK